MNMFIPLPLQPRFLNHFNRCSGIQNKMWCFWLGVCEWPRGRSSDLKSESALESTGMSFLCAAAPNRYSSLTHCSILHFTLWHTWFCSRRLRMTLFKIPEIHAMFRNSKKALSVFLASLWTVTNQFFRSEIQRGLDDTLRSHV